MKVCSDCQGGPVVGRGRCNRCWRRFRRSPDWTPQPVLGQRERLQSGMVVTETGCHEWTRCRNNNGYGVIVTKQKKALAHRVAYELFVGPIPEGLQLDHLCRNRACVNPAHLEPVTHTENMRRAAPARRARREQRAAS